MSTIDDKLNYLIENSGGVNKVVTGSTNTSKSFSIQAEKGAKMVILWWFPLETCCYGGMAAFDKEGTINLKIETSGKDATPVQNKISNISFTDTTISAYLNSFTLNNTSGTIYYSIIY